MPPTTIGINARMGAHDAEINLCPLHVWRGPDHALTFVVDDDDHDKMMLVTGTNTQVQIIMGYGERIVYNDLVIEKHSINGRIVITFSGPAEAIIA